MVIDDALHQRLTQSCLHGSVTLHCRRQLAVVTSKNHSRHSADGNPAGCLQRLRRLVDKQCTELLPFKQPTVAAYKGAGNDTGLAKELGIDAYLKFCGTLFQAFKFLVVFLVAPFAMSPEVSDSLSDGPQQFVVRMGLKSSFIGKGKHLVVDTSRITNTQYVDTAVNKFL